MTLSTSRQQRKSMLPKPRPSSRISARRVTSGDTTSRIARRVPSPLLAISCNNNSSITTQAAVLAAAADCNLTPPEAGLRRAGPGSPSRILPWSAAGQTRTSSDSCPTPDRSEASSTLMSHTPSPSPEVKKRDGVTVNVQYPTPPASAEIKHERFQVFKGQEGPSRGLGRTTGTVLAAQNQDTSLVIAGAGAPPSREQSRRPASVSTTLTLTDTFSRVDNASPRDASRGGIPALTCKKSAFISTNFSGKENRRPRMYTRVPPPPVVSVPTIPPRSIRRTVVAEPPSRAASFRETPPPTPGPLVIRKQLPSTVVGSSPVGSASGASGTLPVVGSVKAGIQALIGNIDRFANEWTELFDELSAGSEDPEDRLSKLNASTRIRTGQPKNTGLLQASNPAAAAGKRTLRQLQPGPSGSTASVSTLQASTLAGTNAETVHFDVTPASQARWQHRDKSLVKEAPEDRPERDLPVVASASATDPQTEKAHHLLVQKAVLRNASLQTTPQASRYLPSVPEISQSSIISGSYLVETTSVVLSNRKDEATNLPQTTSAMPRGIDTARRNGILQQARCNSSATPVPNVSCSPLSNVVSLSAVSSSYSSSPWANLRANDFVTQCPINVTSDTAAVPTRSTSLRGLRAIFKRTSAGLTASHRQRAESLKERISEPRVLSLGSISISNLRDAGVASGCALPMGQEGSTTNTGDLARITAVK